MRILVAVAMAVLLAWSGASAEDAEKDVWEDWFSFAEAQAGPMWSFERDEFMPYFALPTIGYREAALVAGCEFDLEAIDAGPTAGILGVTFYLGSVKDWGIDIPGAQHFGVNVGPVLRYDFETGEKEVCVVASIIDLNLSAGNQKKQRER